MCPCLLSISSMLCLAGQHHTLHEDPPTVILTFVVHVLFARDSVSYTQCQLDTGNDQQNYARPTIQCISNYSNSTSTIEKNNTIHGPSLHHSSWFHQQHVRVIFPWSFPHVGLTWKWHIFPKKNLVDQHCPTFSWLKRRIFHVTISSWAHFRPDLQAQGPRPWPPLKFHWDPLGTLTSWDLFRAQLSIGAPNEALGWKRPAEIDRGWPEMEVREGCLLWKHESNMINNKESSANDNIDTIMTMGVRRLLDFWITINWFWHILAAEFEPVHQSQPRDSPGRMVRNHNEYADIGYPLVI